MENIYEINFIIRRNNRDNKFVTYLMAKNAKEARNQFDNSKYLGIRTDWENAHRFHVKVKRIDFVNPAKIGYTYAK